VVENETLVAESRLLAARLAPELDESTFAAVARFLAKSVGKDVAAIEQAIVELSAVPTLSEQDVAAIILARAASTSPAEINSAIFSQVSPRLTSAIVVELISCFAFKLGFLSARLLAVSRSLAQFKCRTA
jgi:hypothetical protein